MYAFLFVFEHQFLSFCAKGFRRPYARYEVRCAPRSTSLSLARGLPSSSFRDLCLGFGVEGLGGKVVAVACAP